MDSGCACTYGDFPGGDGSGAMTFFYYIVARTFFTCVGLKSYANVLKKFYIIANRIVPSYIYNTFVFRNNH